MGQRLEEKQFMIKKWHFYSTLLLIIAFLSSGFKPFNLDSNTWFLTDGTDKSDYLFPSQKQEDYAKLNIPFTGNFFIGYKEAIAYKESQINYFTTFYDALVAKVDLDKALGPLYSE